MPRNSEPLVSVIIPVHNGERYLGQAIESALQQSYRPIQVVVVDDGSRDHTIVHANRFGAELVVHSRNIGKGRCIREGLEYSLENGCDLVITMDGDGQHDLKEIDNFIEEHKKTGADIVLGNRMHKPKKKAEWVKDCGFKMGPKRHSTKHIRIPGWDGMVSLYFGKQKMLHAEV